MRVNILGGGPAGLYLAILLKKQNPAHRIQVVERNAPDDTFGWGVVFSDETMSNLEEADRETYAQITGEFCRWTEIDIFVEDTKIRSTGHGFCGIARKRLLQILQDRARALGVELSFKKEELDVDAYRKDCDLLVGSDGLRSVVRKRYESVFQPTLDVRKARYIWLGTTRRWETFTFSFRKNEHGLFQIHAYPFDATHGTMIVETDEATFRAAGLDRMSEAESVAYCEKLFAKELDGGRCLPNRSTWIQFTTVRNERWSHENVVILGDAAHTAHFSIGSGTKIALEDAISIAQQIAKAEREGRSIESALQGYEEERKPIVGRIQTAAQQSLEWFENAPRYYERAMQKGEPLELAFSLLTRSRRITHANLKVRDPGLVAEVDRSFSDRSGVEGSRASTKPQAPPPMFSPFRLRDLVLPNRVVVSPMCEYSATDGMPNDWHLVHLGSRAVGGAGLVMAEMTDVTADGRITHGCTGLYSDAHVAAWKRVVDFVHGHSASKIGIQLGHAGRKASTLLPWEGDAPLRDATAWETIAPSPLPYDAGYPAPREMNRADMLALRDAFVAATHRALSAGFDLLELHMAHGYLLSSFLTPLANQRTDEYGGSLENRMRFPLEIFEAVRAAWPKEKPLGVRVSATDWVDGGFTDTDAVVVSRALKERGCDFIDVSTGQTSPLCKPVYGRMYQTPFADRIGAEAGIATIAVGNIQDFDQINTIVASGRADLCALARPHLFDPYFTLHAAAAQGWASEVAWPKQYLAARPR